MLTSAVTYLRMVFVLLGAGVALAFAILDLTVVVLIAESDDVPLAVTVMLATLISVVPIACLGLIPGVREIEATAAQTLLEIDFPGGSPGPARTWADRRRTLVWFVLHLLSGAVIVAIVGGAITAGFGALGLVAIVAAVVLASGLGYALGLVAPGLLGPSYDERISRLESESARLVERNRLAREIHDSIGHALSLITVQASAAALVIDRDRDFAVKALGAIEQASRSAADDLDHALGLLRENGQPSRTSTPDLSALDSLVTAVRSAGLKVKVTTDGDLTTLPAMIGREAYRITQEGLTNAMKHSTDRAATLTVSARPEELAIRLTNTAARTRAERGRGLAGITERAATLDGSAEHSLIDGEFRLDVRIPLTAGRGDS
ncbi:MAG: sensor histidine kinase [Nocardioides sp.]|uniref:sensor histidine kinase n=1 Tax=Nocardioides sp. TaxID=35761 RepID=UPI003D6B67EE